MRSPRVKLPPHRAAKPPPKNAVKLTGPKPSAAIAAKATAAIVKPLGAPVPDDKLLLTEEVAKILRTTARTVTTYVKMGLLDRVQVGPQRTRITRASLVELIGEDNMPAPGEVAS